MLDELNQAIAEYQGKWQRFVGGRLNREFFQALKPVAVGWKVADRAEYDRLCAELHDSCDKIIETWMNGRWIGKMHVRDTKLASGIEIVKVMQRRPGSHDATGLDHVDFYSPEVARAEEVLSQEKDVNWTRETNDAVAGYGWISIWFAGTEAKLKDTTVLDIVIGELGELNRKITGNAP